MPCIGAERKPATLATMSESMKVIKGLVAGDSVMYRDVRLRLRWVDEEGWDLPMWVAGYGPRALDLIGREADGFILQLADPKILEKFVELAGGSAARIAVLRPLLNTAQQFGLLPATGKHPVKWGTRGMLCS